MTIHILQSSPLPDCTTVRVPLRDACAYTCTCSAHESIFRERAFPLPEGARWDTPRLCGRGYDGGESVYGEPVKTWDEEVRATWSAVHSAGLDVSDPNVLPKSTREVRQDTA